MRSSAVFKRKWNALSCIAVRGAASPHWPPTNRVCLRPWGSRSSEIETDILYRLHCQGLSRGNVNTVVKAFCARICSETSWLVFSTTEYFRAINMLMALPGISYWKYNMESVRDLSREIQFFLGAALFNSWNSLGNAVPELETQGLEGTV